jgi:hypothetical protein
MREKKKKKDKLSFIVLFIEIHQGIKIHYYYHQKVLLMRYR